MKIKTTVLLFFLIGLNVSHIKAQESISSISGLGTGSGGSISFSVGLIIYKTLVGPNGSISPGDQQPRELSTEFITLNPSVSASVFPNPVSDVFSIKIEDFQSNNFTYQLSDLYGKIVANNSLDYYVTEISLNDLSKGIYFLRIVKNNKQVQTIKVIKS